MARKAYTNEQREAALACLLANSGNYKKTEAQTGISRATLREWQKGEIAQSSTISTLKKELQEDFLEKLKRTRSRLIDRIYTVAETEGDIFKLSGAFKTVMEAASDVEVNEALAERIRGATEAQAAPRPQGAGSAGSSGGAANLN